MSGGADHSGGLLPRGRLPVGHVGARGPQSHASACASKPRNRQQRSVLLMNRRGLVGPWGPRSWRTVAGKQRGAGGGAPWTSSVQPVRPGVGGRPPGLGGVGCPLESRPTCAPPRITFHSRTCSLAHPTAPTPVKERQTRAVPLGVLGTRDTRVTPGSRGGVCACACALVWRCGFTSSPCVRQLC